MDKLQHKETPTKPVMALDELAKTVLGLWTWTRSKTTIGEALIPKKLWLVRADSGPLWYACLGLLALSIPWPRSWTSAGLPARTRLPHQAPGVTWGGGRSPEQRPTGSASALPSEDVAVPWAARAGVRIGQ